MLDVKFTYNEDHKEYEITEDGKHWGWLGKATYDGHWKFKAYTSDLMSQEIFGCVYRRLKELNSDRV